MKIHSLLALQAYSSLVIPKANFSTFDCLKNVQDELNSQRCFLFFGILKTIGSNYKLFSMCIMRFINMADTLGRQVDLNLETVNVKFPARLSSSS